MAAQTLPVPTKTMTPRSASQQAVLVHGGARDSYQLGVALFEVNLLETLVTDLYWPGDRVWAERLRPKLPGSLRELLPRRYAPSLPSSRVTQLAAEGLRGVLLDRMPGLPFSLRRRSMRSADAALGRAAGRRARRLGAGLVTYSYFAWHAIHAYRGPAMLFQVHPHPSTVRRILNEELALHPECAPSLQQEWEIALPGQDFQRLVEEPGLASRILVASSFTKLSLVENGTPPEDITVIPYGVDLERFRPATQRSRDPAGPLKLLFVGRINQRKGVSYLLEALRHFTPRQVHLTVCGRVVDDLKLFEPFADQVTIRPSVTNDQLVAAYQAADLFVFPSVAEGFGQVLLEALACGLPILTTTSTAAPDLITDGVEGFILPPRRPDLLVDRLRWSLEHRPELEAMHVLARKQAESFTWARFRARCATAVASYLEDERLRQTSPHA